MIWLMISPPSVLVGSQRPRVEAFPAYVGSAGVEAVELCRAAGLVLDAWQERVLSHSLGEKPDGSWAAFEVGLCVSRQNGKGSLLEARELAGLFLLGERLLIHSAHQFDTSLEAFRRLLFLIENTDDLRKRVKRVSRSHGEEGIELLSGQRIRFRTRTKGGGRGFTGDWLGLDEAMILPESAHGALLPTLSARPNPQVWYTGSAVDRMVHPDGVVFARIRERGLAGNDPSLAYFEWSADYPNPSDVPDSAAVDPDAWAVSNPGLGIRISPEHVGHEQRSMDPRTFAVERLGVGDWPATDGGDAAIPLTLWDALTDPGSRPVDPVVFAFDVSKDRSWATISVAGKRQDGLAHVEVVDRRRGTGWLVARILELVKAHKPQAVVCDSLGPAATVVPELEAAGVMVDTVNGPAHAEACGLLFDAVEQSTVRHLGTSELRSAIRAAATRPLGDKWAWARKSSAGDITPLVSCTLAFGAAVRPQAAVWVGW